MGFRVWGSATFWKGLKIDLFWNCFIFKNTLNTAEIFGIDNIGNIGLGSTYQLLINPPTALLPASFQTIQQGVGNNQNITFQSAANSGNVAIGTVDPLGYKLYINGAVNTTNTTGTAGPNGFSLGGHLGTSEFSDGNVSFLLVYNRELTAAEILQNYQVFRNRLGV